MTRSVLIVDDSLTVRMDLAEAFQAQGYEARLARSAAEARAAFAAGLPDLVILDLVLPDGDGVTLLQELRALPGGDDAAVLMLSSESEVRDRIRGLATGANDYVGKPYDTGYVLARAGELVKRRHATTVSQRTVLVVDDSPTFRGAVREALIEAGYAVVAAATGEEGLRLAAMHTPDAALIDGQLPGIDGATVIRRLRLDEMLRGTPCVLMTAEGRRGAELQAMEAGADAFVTKDEDVSVILARLGAILRGARGARDSVVASSLAGKRILAVDDSPTHLEALGDALRGEGYDVALAMSGEMALDLLAVQHVDLILLDLVMPGLGGEETCRRIKSAPLLRDIPLLIVTGVEDRQTMVQALGAGADDYIAKSADFDVLKARVRAQMRRRQFEEQTRRIRDRLLERELEAANERAARELAETRAALVDELERKNKELEAFSYSVSHDLRAPLRGILGFSEMLLDGDGLGEDTRAGIERIRGAGNRMNDLIDALLELSVVARGELERTAVDLSELAHAVAGDLSRTNAARNVEWAIAPGLFAQADVSLVRAVLENLMSNAWKYSAKVAHARIEVGTVARDGEPAFFVRDNGAGFPSRQASRLFRPFQRLHADDEFAGTGIGLATVMRIVERHGGRVSAEAAVGEGATFYFTLPAPKGSRS